MILTKPRTCRECGKPLDPDRKANTEFCATACRIAWRNRRMSRGADLYDAFMAMRFDREAAKDKGLWALMCRMASNWNEEDKTAGRQSYFPPDETVMRNVQRQAVIVARGRKPRGGLKTRSRQKPD